MTERAITDTECKLLDYFDKLNDFGKQTLLAAAEGLTKHSQCMKTVEITKTGNVIQLIRQ